MLDYCQKMSMSCSYKPVLIMAVLDHGGEITLDEAASFFLRFYSQRLEKGLVAEKSNSIFSNLNCTYDEMIKNIKSNPVKALLNSSCCFRFDSDSNVLSVEPSLWNTMRKDQILRVKAVCLERLERYYRSITLTEKSNTRDSLYGHYFV